jgi:hypothetical protein
MYICIHICICISIYVNITLNTIDNDLATLSVKRERERWNWLVWLGYIFVWLYKYIYGLLIGDMWILRWKLLILIKPYYLQEKGKKTLFELIWIEYLHFNVYIDPYMHMCYVE